MIMLWKFWEARNNVVFLNQQVDAESICDVITKHIPYSYFGGERPDSKDKGPTLSIHIPPLISWIPPNPSYWKLNTDVA